MLHLSTEPSHGPGAATGSRGIMSRVREIQHASKQQVEAAKSALTTHGPAFRELTRLDATPDKPKAPEKAPAAS